MLFGQQASDAECYVMASAVAERLGRPCVTQAASLDLADGSLRVKRQTETGYDTVEVPMPAVVSVSDAINEPRYPSLPAIMGAKRKPHEVLSLADAGIDAGAVGTEGSRTKVDGLSTPPARRRSGQDRGRRHRGREDRGLPRRAQGGRLMAGILVLAERQDGAYSKGSLGLIEEAARLGAALSEPVHALVCGDADDATAAALGSHGASVVHVAAGDAYGLAQPRRRRRRRRCRATESFRYLLFGASIVASDAAAGIAVRLDAGLVIDAVELHDEGGELVTRRAGLGDSVLAHCGFTTPVGVVVVRANTFAPADESAGSGGAEVRRFTPELRSFSTAASIVGHEQADQSGVDITEADVLVGGGRGLGKPENFSLCEDLADALGGAVAATRAVVDAGWYPYATQVGQTGKSVSPKLLHRGRHLRRDPAQGRHAVVPGDRRDQQGRRTRRSSTSPTSAWSATCTRSSRS